MLKKILIPVVAAAMFALVAPSSADASPLNRTKTPHAFGGKIRIGVGIGIPIGRRHRTSHVRHVESGYYRTVYEYRTVKVWHPAEQVGFDSHGHPVYSEGHYDYVKRRVAVRVWVPTVTTVHHRGYRYGPRGHISVGGVWRIR